MVSFHRLCILSVCGIITLSNGFVIPSNPTNARAAATTTTSLNGLFDNWSAGGSGNSKASLDEEWEKQQEILRNRRKPKSERDEYFKSVEKRRQEASKKQSDLWSWQTKSYKKEKILLTNGRNVVKVVISRILMISMAIRKRLVAFHFQCVSSY